MQPKCLKCKGRGFCGRVVCPIVAKASALFRICLLYTSDAADDGESVRDSYKSRGTMHGFLMLLGIGQPGELAYKRLCCTGAV